MTIASGVKRLVFAASLMLTSASGVTEDRKVTTQSGPDFGFSLPTPSLTTNRSFVPGYVGNDDNRWPRLENMYLFHFVSPLIDPAARENLRLNFNAERAKPGQLSVYRGYSQEIENLSNLNSLLFALQSSLVRSESDPALQTGLERAFSSYSAAFYSCAGFHKALDNQPGSEEYRRSYFNRLGSFLARVPRVVVLYIPARLELDYRYVNNEEGHGPQFYPGWASRKANSVDFRVGWESKIVCRGPNVYSKGEPFRTYPTDPGYFEGTGVYHIVFEFGEMITLPQPGFNRQQAEAYYRVNPEGMMLYKVTLRPRDNKGMNFVSDQFAREHAPFYEPKTGVSPNPRDIGYASVNVTASVELVDTSGRLLPPGLGADELPDNAGKPCLGCYIRSRDPNTNGDAGLIYGSPDGSRPPPKKRRR